MRATLLLAVVLAGCSGSPAGPSSPSAPPTAFTGTVVDTVTGAPVAGYTAVLSGGRVTISAPGYLTRDTASTAVVDLIRDSAPFDLAFYRQFARNGLDAPGALRPLMVQAAPPRVYLHTVDTAGRALDPGLVDATAATLTATAAALGVPLAGLERGAAPRDRATGWITVAWLGEREPGTCGRTSPNAPGPLVLLNYQYGPGCSCGALAMGPRTVAHEMGHALGFTHTDGAVDLMRDGGPACSAAPSERERFHAQIAYKRKPGNLDVDRDQ